MDFGLLLLRLVVGLALAAHGAQKLFGAFGGPGLSGTTQLVDSLRFRPARVHAWLLAVGEFVGGLLLALGLLTPLAAAIVLGVMVAAILAVHARKGFFVSKGGIEFPLVVGAAAAALGFTGPGAVSIDGWAGWHLATTGWGIAALVAGIVVAAILVGARRLPWWSGRGLQPAQA